MAIAVQQLTILCWTFSGMPGNRLFFTGRGMRPLPVLRILLPYRGVIEFNRGGTQEKVNRKGTQSDSQSNAEFFFNYFESRFEQLGYQNRNAVVIQPPIQGQVKPCPYR